jgi:hypothetical protein
MSIASPEKVKSYIIDQHHLSIVFKEMTDNGISGQIVRIENAKKYFKNCKNYKDIYSLYQHGIKPKEGK